ncbi:hypothetical protein [Nocardiopsis nanhaiensis]
MRVFLPDGHSVQLSEPMGWVLWGAVPMEPRSGSRQLAEGTPRDTARALESRGLVRWREQDGPWVVTEHGVRVRAVLLRMAERAADGDLGGVPFAGELPRRETVDPELSRDEAARLRGALDLSRSAPGPELTREDIAARSALLMGLMTVTSLPLSLWVWFPESVGLALLTLVVFAGHLLFGAAWVSLFHEVWWSVRLARAHRTLEAFRGRYVSADMLDRRASDMLARAQRAVDTVLDSPIHRRGLLLDRPRNRVVLTESEWAVADSLCEQTQTRARLNSTTPLGERSRRAAQRVGAALLYDVERVEARIRVLESYAAKVRRAEDQERDRELAARLDGLADRIIVAGAAHDQQDESVCALVDAQRMALEVAGQGPDDEPGPTGGTGPLRPEGGPGSPG